MEPDSVGGNNWTAKLVTLETLRLRDNNHETAVMITMNNRRASSLDTMISEYLQKIVKRATTVIEEGYILKERYKIRGAAYVACDQCDLAQKDFEKAIALPDKKHQRFGRPICHQIPCRQIPCRCQVSPGRPSQ